MAEHITLLGEKMGYYLNLIFESGEMNDHEAIMKKLSKAGSREVPIDLANDKHNATNFLHPEIPFFITLMRDKLYVEYACHGG